MSGDWRTWFWNSAYAIASASITVPGTESMVLAQIIPDETLGAESSVVTPDNIKGLESVRISGGAIRGSNLFHSFREFNIGEGRGGYFENPAAIANIFSRVTGSNPSEILGTLGVLGNANLFFLNPNGILFGPNASLDIRGSFLGTTADSIVFPDGKQFSATNPEAPPILTVNVQQPIGLEFQGKETITLASQASIANESNLAVENGQTLTLIGGDVSLDGGSLIAPEGRVELGGLAGAGTVRLNKDGSLSFPEGVARADVSITNGAVVEVTAGGGGYIAVKARNLELSGRSALFAGIGRGLGTANAQAGDIEINATDTVFLDGESAVFNGVERGAVGNAGNINITTDSLSVTNGAFLGSTTRGEGNAGNVIVNAIDSVSFDGNSFALGQVEATGIGQGGNINITTGNLSLNNDSLIIAETRGKGNTGDLEINATSVFLGGGSQLSSDIRGQGNGGNVIINATDSVSFDRLGSGIFARVFERAEGRGSNIKITTQNFALTNGAQMVTTTLGKGNAGSVTINATDSISFDGVFSEVRSNVEETGRGNAGNINITAEKLSLINNAQLRADTFGQGNGGQVSIQATDSVKVSGADIFSGAGENAIGKAGSIAIETGFLELTNGARLGTSTFGKADAGDIKIRTGSLSMVNGARLQAFTSGEGNGGNITIDATDQVSFDGMGQDELFTVTEASTEVREGAEGNAGNINITTEKLSLTNDAQLVADTFGQGNGGQVSIKATDSVKVSGADIFSGAGENASGKAGSIAIETGSLELTNGARLRTSTAGKVDAGSIEIRTGSLSVVNDSRLQAFTSGEGNGGNITINATDKVSFDGMGKRELFTAASTDVLEGAEGNAGNINITTEKLSLTNDALLFATTNGQGDGGQVSIQATDSVKVSGADIFSDTGENASGKAGSIAIETGSLELTNGARLRTSTAGKVDAGSIEIRTGSLSVVNDSRLQAFTSGEGNGGNITINATDKVFFDGMGKEELFNAASTDVLEGAEGNGGSIKIMTSSLKLVDAAQVTASTSGVGNAGDITLEVEESITLAGTGSGIFANTRKGSSGRGGSIIIDPNTVIIRDGARIAVNSDGSGIGGNIDLQAGSLTLEQGTITAETASNQGGDINLTISDLLTLRNHSQITATAGTDEAGGNGGNITIDVPFIIAFPNEDSNIQANAFEGNGGNITINTNGIFGIEFRDQETPLSDITASSEFGQQGEVEINTSGIDPTRGLNNLPQEAVEAEVAQGCQTVGGQSTLEFFDIGRGGLPPSPDDLFSSETVIAEWIPLDLAQDQTLDEMFSEAEFTTTTLLQLSC